MLNKGPVFAAETQRSRGRNQNVETRRASLRNACGVLGRAPCQHARLRLVTKTCKKCGLLAFVFSCTVLFVTAAAYGQPDAAALADAIQSRYQRLRSFKADFVQIYRSAFAEEQESGVLYMKKPGKMRWEYTTPTIKLFVLDGRKTYFYVPRDKQVSVADWESNFASPALLFLLGKGDLNKDFDLAQSDKEPKLAGGDIVLLLTPRTEQAGFKEVLLEVREQGADILRLSVTEHNGNRNDYLLRSFQANVAIADGKFSFKVPKGVEVITAEK